MWVLKNASDETIPVNDVTDFAKSINDLNYVTDFDGPWQLIIKISFVDVLDITKLY